MVSYCLNLQTIWVEKSVNMPQFCCNHDHPSLLHPGRSHWSVSFRNLRQVGSLDASLARDHRRMMEAFFGHGLRGFCWVVSKDFQGFPLWFPPWFPPRLLWFTQDATYMRNIDPFQVRKAEQRSEKTSFCFVSFHLQKPGFRKLNSKCLDKDLLRCSWRDSTPAELRWEMLYTDVYCISQDCQLESRKKTLYFFAGGPPFSDMMVRGNRPKSPEKRW